MMQYWIVVLFVSFGASIHHLFTFNKIRNHAIENRKINSTALVYYNNNAKNNEILRKLNFTL